MSRASCPLEPGSLIWGYARDSGGETQDLSVLQQEAAIQTYCEDHGLVLMHVFKDEARPGNSTVGRDAFDDLMHLARQEPAPVQGVVVWSLSRFARNVLDAQFNKADLRRRGYELISLSDILPDGEYAAIIETLIDWKNERFLRDLSRDVKRGLHALARQGYAPGGRPPVGYMALEVTIGRRRDGSAHVVSRWVPDPDKADFVRRAWRMKAGGATHSEIHEATHLYRTKGTYSSMFDNETYLGILKCGDLRIEGKIEALIGRETWDAVQAVRQQHKRQLRTPTQHPRRKSSPYMLSGLAVCAHCSAPMTGGTDNVARGCPWTYYRCGRKKREGPDSCVGGRVNGKTLERAVLNALTERVLTTGYQLRLAEETSARIAASGSHLDREIGRAERELAAKNSAIENLLDQAESGVEAVTERLRIRDAERKELLGRLRALEHQRDLRQVRVDPEVMTAMLAGMRETLKGHDLQAKRTLLRRFVVQVEASKDRAKLSLTFPLTHTGLQGVAPRGVEPLFPA